MKKTVRYYMENELCGIGFRGNEYVRAVNYAIQRMNNAGSNADRIISTLPMKKKDGTEVMAKECWETYADDYEQGSLDWLFCVVRSYYLTWCLNVIHSLK